MANALGFSLVSRRSGCARWLDLGSKCERRLESPYSAYRLVRVRSLPVPHNPSRLPVQLSDDWKALCRAAGHHQGLRARRGRDRWVRKQRARLDLAEVWDIAAVDLALAAELATRIWERAKADGEMSWQPRRFWRRTIPAK